MLFCGTLDIGLEPGEAWVIGSGATSISKGTITNDKLSGVYYTAIVNIKGLGYKKISQQGVSGYTYAYAPEISTTRMNLTNATATLPDGAEFIIVAKNQSSNATINFLTS